MPTRANLKDGYPEIELAAEAAGLISRVAEFDQTLFI